MREFSDVFSKEFPRLPPQREEEVSIDVLPNISLITQAPYQMALVELVKLKVQL